MIMIDPLRRFLLWSTIINYAVLIVWALVFFLAGDWMYRQYGRWFHFSRDQFDALNYGGMSVYKIGIMLLNLVPLIALTFLSR
jgi:hypothetical protein